jgi:ElaB/YqjD/DUF883 family membrane-anchored ribosome-binding protein
MATATDTTGRLESARAEIARLRAEVDALMKDRVTPAVSDFMGRAEKAVSGARDVVGEQSQAVAGQVKERPLLAIAIAAAIGWVIGRAMR